MKSSRKASTSHGNEKSLGELFLQLPEKDMVELINKLRVLAKRRRREDPDELVNSAVCKLLAGSRKLNPNYTLTENLLFIVNSIARNENTKDRRLIQLDEADATAPGSCQSILALTPPTPAQSFEAAEAEHSFAQKVVERGTELDPSLGRILASALRLGWKPLEIARELKIPVSEVYTSKRRLFRNRAILLDSRTRGGV